MRYRSPIKGLLFLTIFVCLARISFSQSYYIDSLRKVLSIAKEDTNKVLLLGTLSLNVTDPVVGKRYANEAIFLAKKLNYAKGIAIATKNLATNYKREGRSESAFANYFKAASMFEKLGDKARQAGVYSNLAELHYIKGDYDVTLAYLLKSLKIKEDLGHEKAVAGAKNNIGNIYYQQENYTKAMQYFDESMQTFQRYDDQIRIANTLDNQAGCLVGLGKLEKALEKYEEALAIRREYKLLANIGLSYINMGQCYLAMGDLKKAMNNHKEALRIEELQGNKPAIIYSLLGIGEIYNNMNRLNVAEQYLERAIRMSRELGMRAELSQGYKLLSENYYKGSRFKKAYDYYQIHISFKDSLFSKEKSEQILMMEALFRSEKSEKENELLNKDNQIKNAELEKADLQNTSILVGLGLTIILLIFVLRSYYIKRKAHELLEDRNLEIERKNRDTTASIEYAHRIQQATLPSKEGFLKIMPNSFILFQPKDIVSGDFYWYQKVDNKVIWAVIDCTGHGVPGAFMSLISHELLKDIVVVNKITEPGNILQQLHNDLINTLQKDQNDSFAVDGMNVAICCYDSKQIKMEFGSSGRPLLQFSGDKVETHSGDKFPIGLITRKVRKFKTKVIPCKPGDHFYIFTDGFSDQFGGEGAKKLAREGLIDAVFANRKRPFDRQEEELLSFFNAWKGDNRQLDDVCMIGVRV
ncbi:MAG: tetratricopeptide repeat protein [Flavobacteriales bacterium]|nr:tetratricopeptide repeat protein [Flavobacteriales bacterium]